LLFGIIPNKKTQSDQEEKLSATRILMAYYKLLEVMRGVSHFYHFRKICIYHLRFRNVMAAAHHLTCLFLSLKR